ncbi:MAG: tyrosine-type recombinase/integrase [Candidatus Poribacteria bacterium]|nr:tyrosine-type recombinase/integrase [Candidatus Poribacteria bacterium]
MPYQHKREPLNREETDRLVNAAESFEEKLVVFTLLDTGLRVAEFAGLKKDNIQWQERRLVIFGKGGPYGKKTKRRIVPMTGRVRLLLEKQFAFENEIGMSDRTVQRLVKRVANRAGIAKPVSPHVLRHTFSVMCVQKGISTRALQSLLGHDRLSTTELYLNLSPEEAVREFREKW